MLFRLLKSFFPPFIMWIDGEGETGLGTGGETTITTGEVQTSTESPSGIETPTEPVVSIQEVQHLREENKRLQEYAEFIKQVPQEPIKQIQKPDIPPDTITYAEDVDKIVDYKLNMFMQIEEQKAVERELRNIAIEKKTSDPQFDARMELALEFMERDEISQGQFNRARTAKEKIEVLEKCAKWNPRYGSLQNNTVQQEKESIVQKLKENSEIPPTLNTMQTAVQTRKSVQDMSDEEYKKFFKDLTKGY